MKQGLLISELSRQANVPVSTIRYYERKGLLMPSERTRSQYRLYSQEAEKHLQFIQKAKRFGLSLEEIKQILDLSDQGIAPCKRVMQMLKHHLDEVDRHIQEVMEFRQNLTRLYIQFEQSIPDSPVTLDSGDRDGKICGLIEQSDR